MYGDVYKRQVQQHPLCGFITLGVMRHLIVIVLQVPLYIVRQCLNLRSGGRRADAVSYTHLP